MATGLLPVPTVPSGTTVVLKRISGRPVPMYYDAGLTQGPVYLFLTSGVDPTTGQPLQPLLWADSGLYDLETRQPGGAVTTSRVQVGVGQTPAPVTNDYVTNAELVTALTTERATAASTYADVAGPETISGAWNFATAPTVGGAPIGVGSGGVTQTYVDTALAAERSTSDTRYAQVGSPETISAAWDFTVRPTYNGVPLGGGYSPPVGGIPYADLTQAVRTALDLAGTAVQPGALNLGTAASRNTGVTTGTLPLAEAVLLRGDNLSTLTDKAAARTALELGPFATAPGLVPGDMTGFDAAARAAVGPGQFLGYWHGTGGGVELAQDATYGAGLLAEWPVTAGHTYHIYAFLPYDTTSVADVRVRIGGTTNMTSTAVGIIRGKQGAAGTVEVPVMVEALTARQFHDNDGGSPIVPFVFAGQARGLVEISGVAVTIVQAGSVSVPKLQVFAAQATAEQNAATSTYRIRPAAYIVVTEIGV